MYQYSPTQLLFAYHKKIVLKESGEQICRYCGGPAIDVPGYPDSKYRGRTRPNWTTEYLIKAPKSVYICSACTFLMEGRNRQNIYYDPDNPDSKKVGAGLTVWLEPSGQVNGKRIETYEDLINFFEEGVPVPYVSIQFFKSPIELLRKYISYSMSIGYDPEIRRFTAYIGKREMFMTLHPQEFLKYLKRVEEEIYLPVRDRLIEKGRKVISPLFVFSKKFHSFDVLTQYALAVLNLKYDQKTKNSTA